MIHKVIRLISCSFPLLSSPSFSLRSFTGYRRHLRGAWRSFRLRTPSGHLVWRRTRSSSKSWTRSPCRPLKVMFQKYISLWSQKDKNILHLLGSEEVKHHIQLKWKLFNLIEMDIYALFVCGQLRMRRRQREFFFHTAMEQMSPQQPKEDWNRGRVWNVKHFINHDDSC